MRLPFYQISTIAGCIVILTACGQKDSTANHTDASSETEATAIRIEIEPSVDGWRSGETIQPWVDQLNIREQPSAQAKKVSSARRGESLTYIGEQTDRPETIVLRGVAYVDNWLKVRTKNQAEGWVFAGAIKREGEYKGNTVIDALHFDFPAFGRFDLTKWKLISTNDSTEGDAETATSVYQLDGQLLEISRVDMGDYGYRNDYLLMDNNRNVLKERSFHFAVDPELQLVETVTDYTNTPPIRYVRSQPMNEHFAQLNARPQMATGKWTESTISAHE